VLTVWIVVVSDRIDRFLWFLDFTPGVCMVSFTKFCSLGKSECEKFKESDFLPFLNTANQVEPIPNRTTGSSPARLSEVDVGMAERA
jgi:hypothetical protein